MRSFQAAGRSSTREIAAHQRELELEAQEDVQVVGDLVGLDADQRRLDEVGRAHERVERDVAQLLGERVLDLGQVALPERARAADHVLPEARLRLVQAERGGGAAERALDLARQALLVEAVAGLVQHREEAGEEVVLALARRQAHVAGREAGGERVRRLVEPPGLEVEADRRRQAGADGALLAARDRCGARTRRRAAAARRSPARTARARRAGRAAAAPAAPRACRARTGRAARRSARRPRSRRRRPPRAAATRGARAGRGRARSRTRRARPARPRSPPTRPARARARASRGRAPRGRARAAPRARGRARTRRGSRRSPSSAIASPKRSSQMRSCRTPASVALASPRAVAPRGGMLTCSSQPSSPPTRPSWQTSRSNCSKTSQALACSTTAIRD